MKNTKKIIACLYAGIVAAGAAQTITFNGTDTIQGHDYLKFKLSPAIYGIQIDKVEVDDNALRQWLQQHNMANVEVNLVIPGETQGKQTYIGEQAFKLWSSRLRINIKFEKTVVNKVNPVVYVQFPKNCGYMFSSSSSITGIDFDGVNTYETKNTSHMFEFCENLARVNFGTFNAGRVEDMSDMFRGCSSLISLDLSGLRPYNVKDMNSMFEDCTSLREVNLRNFNTRNVTDMSSMFCRCHALTNIDDISSFNTGNVINMEAMFMDCKSLQNLNLGHFDMRKVFHMGRMFCDCTQLAALTLPPAQNRIDMAERLHMFAGCSNLHNIQGFTIIYRNFMTDGMFDRCPAGAQFNFPH